MQTIESRLFQLNLGHAPDGQSLGYGISGSIVSVTTQFPTTGTSQSPNCVYQYQSNLYLTNSLTLPNGQQFTFEYDPVFRELTRVNLPTGGYIKYVYQTFPSMDDGPPVNTSCVIWLDSRRVVERRVSSDGVNEEVWTYSYPPSGATEVTDPLGNVSVHLFLNRIYEYSTELRNGAGVPLRRTINDWGGEQGPIQLNQDGSHLTGPKNRRMTASTITLLDTNQVSKTETDYDQFTYQSELPPYNNVTESRMNGVETREYDYGVGSPGPLVRKTTFTYSTNANYLNRHIWGLLTSKKVYDGSGNLKAHSETLYDTHALATTSGAAVQHDYTNYGTGMNYRGNPTESKAWRNTDGSWLTSKTWYDDLGNVTQTRDPLLHDTYFSYADSWVVSRIL